MKKITTYILISLCAVYANAEQGTWVQKTSMPSNAINRAECGAFSINGKGYVFGGVIAYPNWLDETWEYDPVADAWTQKATIPATLREPAFFVIGNKGYAGTGMSGTSNIQTFYEFDPGANKWTAKKNFPGTARRDAVAFAIGSKGYMGTGAASSGKTKDFYEYDPSNDTWTPRTSLNGAVRDAAISFSIGVKGYVTTGRNGSTTYNDCWEYDAVANAWTQKATFPGVTRSEAVSFVLGTKAYVGSGHTGGVNDFFAYDQSNNSWDSVPTLPGFERAEAVAFAVNGKGYVCNGYLLGNGTQKDIWEYTPASSTGIIESSTINNLKIFPNPTNGDFYISASIKESEPIDIRIINLLGQTVYQTKTSNKSLESLHINIPNPIPGIYKLQIQAKQEIQVKEFIIK